MSRKFTASMPEHPEGYDKRMTRETPRDASDNSAYEERIYQDSAKLAGTFTGTPKDTNLFGRVKDVRSVAQTVGHEVKDYPGENTWFIKAVLTDTADQNRCLTLNLASGKNFKAVASPNGAYYNSLEYCNDNLTWNALPLNTDITPYTSTTVSGFVFSVGGTAITCTRVTTKDKTREVEGVKVPMYGWSYVASSTTYYLYTATLTITEGSLIIYGYDETTGMWTDPETLNVSSVISSSEYLIWLRGRILHKGGVCPKLSGNADAITKVEGDLSSLLDYRATSVVAPNSGTLGHIFQGCTALSDASGLVLPTGNPRGSHPYWYMFENCTALTSAPNLSNVPVVVNSTFYGMFKGCTALTTAPALPRPEVLTAHSYREMFYGCTHLSSVTVYIGSHIKDYGLLNWMYNAGTAVNGQCTFNHAGNFRWRYPSKSGIPGASADNQKEWTPVPALTTKLYFSTQFGGTVSAQVGTATIASGDSVIYNQGVTVTPTPSTGYIFDSWVKKPAGATVGEGGVLTFNMPYGRYEDGEDKVECVASFVVGGNLLVNYKISGTFSEIAYVRNPEHDIVDGQGAPANYMYAWDSVNDEVIGGLFTITLQITKDTALYAQNDDESWYSSSAYIAEDITTTDYTVAVFDRVTANKGSVTVRHSRGEFKNFVKEFCVSIAPAADTVYISTTDAGCIGWDNNTEAVAGATADFKVAAIDRGLGVERLDYLKSGLELTGTSPNYSTTVENDSVLLALLNAAEKKSRIVARLSGSLPAGFEFSQRLFFTWSTTENAYVVGDLWKIEKTSGTICTISLKINP